MGGCKGVSSRGEWPGEKNKNEEKQVKPSETAPPLLSRFFIPPLDLPYPLLSLLSSFVHLYLFLMQKQKQWRTI